MKYRKLLCGMLVLTTVTLGACNEALGPAKKWLDARRGNIDSRYPGPMDQTLTEDQRIKLRERANYQRETQKGL